MKILIKAIQPHRQKVLTADGEEIRLQRWANKKAANELRGAGGDAAGEQFNQARDKLMRDAVANPEEHGLKFLNERLPFEGQNLQESLSDPMDSPEFKEDMTEDESFSLAEKLDEKYRTPDLFDSEGKLRDGMPSEEEEFKPDAEAEHLRRIMTSRQVLMRDAWSVLKQEPYLRFPADAGKRPEFQRMPGEEHGPNDKFFRYGEDPYVPKAHGENPMRAERPHPYSQLGTNVMEDYQLMQEEPENNQLLTPDELAFAQFIAENDMRMPPAASMPAPTLRQGMNQYNPPIKTSRQVPMRDAWSILKFGYPAVEGVEVPEEVRARHNVAPKCKVCQGKLEEVHPGEGEMVCMNANCPAQMMTQSEDQPPRLRFPADQNALRYPDYSQDLGY